MDRIRCNMPPPLAPLRFNRGAGRFADPAHSRISESSSHLTNYGERHAETFNFDNSQTKILTAGRRCLFGEIPPLVYLVQNAHGSLLLNGGGAEWHRTQLGSGRYHGRPLSA